MQGFNPEDFVNEDILKLDQELYNLALYDVGHGQIFCPDNIEQVYEIKYKVARKYNYFKKLIQNGDCTVDWLRHEVLIANGPIKQKDVKLDEVLKTIVNQPDICHEKTSEEEALNNFYKSLVEEMNKVREEELRRSPDEKKKRKRRQIDNNECQNEDDMQEDEEG